MTHIAFAGGAFDPETGLVRDCHAELGQPVSIIDPASFAENLTSAGKDIESAADLDFCRGSRFARRGVAG
jgi:hypothetical protein